METNKLTKEQRNYIMELNSMFNHNWSQNFLKILMSGYYNDRFKNILNGFKQPYLKHKKNYHGDVICKIYIESTGRLNENLSEL